MKKMILPLILALASAHCLAQNKTGQHPGPTKNVQSDKSSSEKKKSGTKKVPVKKMALDLDGYIIYKSTTLRGRITLRDTGVGVERPINDTINFTAELAFRDTGLKKVMLYSVGKLPICLVRTHPADKKIYRMVHEGKLSIYDDRISEFYSGDINKKNIVVKEGDVVHNIHAVSEEKNKSDLIGYINKAYGLTMKPNTTDWVALMKKVDELDKEQH